MKDSTTYEQRQSADRMEAVLLLASGVGVIVSIFVFAYHGWPAGVLALLLSLVIFSLARLFDLMSEIMGRIGRLEEYAKSIQPAKEKPAS
jgi:hypothetical protein